jgi:hypothetical protein
MEPTSSGGDSLPVQERCAIRRPTGILDYLGQHRFHITLDKSFGNIVLCQTIGVK